jgi:hypothetical protein
MYSGGPASAHKEQGHMHGSAFYQGTPYQGTPSDADASHGVGGSSGQLASPVRFTFRHSNL